jgi:sugar phosphate isomerase/epimerase
MRLGVDLKFPFKGPEDWAGTLKARGFDAAVWPFHQPVDRETENAFKTAAADNDIMFAEVGIWCNPLHPDKKQREEKIRKICSGLALADRIGARCCVSVGGSRGESWIGWHPRDLSDETFEKVAETAQKIIDTVKPKRTWYVIETMPWMIPDSPDVYLRLLSTVDRERFAVHLDPVNMITSPRRYFESTAFLKECFTKLGPRIRSCHAKDTLLEHTLTAHLKEVPPGKGSLNYETYISLAESVDPEMPFIMEHLQPDQVDAAAGYIRGKAAGIREG